MAYSPDPTEVDVGLWIRLWRQAANVTQVGLGESLDLTFQQAQNHETGVSRVLASVLVKIARRLNPAVAALVGEQDNGARPIPLLHLTAAPGAARLLRASVNLSPEAEEHVIGLMERMAATGAPVD